MSWCADHLDITTRAARTTSLLRENRQLEDLLAVAIGVSAGLCILLVLDRYWKKDEKK